MYSVYSVTDTANKPMAFQIAASGLSRREANALARSMRRNGTTTAVYAGNDLKSLHNRP